MEYSKRVYQTAKISREKKMKTEIVYDIFILFLSKMIICMKTHCLTNVKNERESNVKNIIIAEKHMDDS